MTTKKGVTGHWHHTGFDSYDDPQIVFFPMGAFGFNFDPKFFDTFGDAKADLLAEIDAKIQDMKDFRANVVALRNPIYR